MTLCYTTIAQNKTCETNKNNNIVELNTITFNKCSSSKRAIVKKSVTQKQFKAKPSKPLLKKSVTNTITISEQKIRKVNTNSSIDENAHYVRKKKTSLTDTKHSLNTSTLLFSLVDEVPLFPECLSTLDKNCFVNTFEKYFSKNFDTERISEDNLNKRVFIQFTINTHGHVSSIHIKGSENNINLSKEIKRTLNKLPNFKPGKHQGIPVAVKFSLPLNFNTD